MKHSGIKAALLFASLALSGAAAANGQNCDNDPFNFFTDPAKGWTQLDAGGFDGKTNPGYGGQDFDAEYLFYKYDSSSNNLSIGLQAGFDLIDGKVTYGDWWNRADYFSGDLALSFDGSTNGANGAGYEYAVDFGLFTQTLGGDAVSIDGDGSDAAGLYKVTSWNNDISLPVSSPFAMDGGELLTDALIKNDSGFGETGSKTTNSRCGGTTTIPCTSYYRVVTFNLDDVIGNASDFTVDAHWTMSCGNDYINGHTDITRNDVPVPEPSILALFSLGSLALVSSGYRRRKMKA